MMHSFYDPTFCTKDGVQLVSLTTAFFSSFFSFYYTERLPKGFNVFVYFVSSRGCSI